MNREGFSSDITSHYNTKSVHVCVCVVPVITHSDIQAKEKRKRWHTMASDWNVGNSSESALFFAEKPKASNWITYTQWERERDELEKKEDGIDNRLRVRSSPHIKYVLLRMARLKNWKRMERRGGQPWWYYYYDYYFSSFFTFTIHRENKMARQYTNLFLLIALLSIGFSHQRHQSSQPPTPKLSKMAPASFLPFFFFLLHISSLASKIESSYT